MNTTHDLGNNETITTGIVPQNDGAFLALTRTASKTFKSRRGAVAWLSARGYKADGSRNGE